MFISFVRFRFEFYFKCTGPCMAFQSLKKPDKNPRIKLFIRKFRYSTILSKKMVDSPDCDFPVLGLLPKKETGVVTFLTKYPENDGRNTIIAILDSGVDPAAAGLKVTSTGETKVIERYDCSGAGDVDTTTIIRELNDGFLTGLTTKKLKIPETWNNPSGCWRIGVLHPYSLYPAKLKERVEEHRKQHNWSKGYGVAYAKALKQLQDLETEYASKNGSLSTQEKLYKEELETRLEVLQNADKKYTDVGPTYDCVLYHDGTMWRACIDTSEKGDLASGVHLGEYSLTHQHQHLTPLDQMTVSINVHDDGDTLEVVGMCSTHGTHVAAIAAGYFPEEPEVNGVAPGAKIVSLTIGDSRLGSMETGAALVRACTRIMRISETRRVDVVNMSYGEHANWSNAGRVGDVICEVVNKYGVSWVVSAGNQGPALCTVGAPPDIAQSTLIGVGAYVSPEMMRAAYSMRADRGAASGAGAYSWSSRGPAADGALGLSVCAPGGALTSVARFTLKSSVLMNGTSMAAPHVAGAVAALISGLRAKGLPFSPYSMKRALENSATFMDHVEPWAQGCGLLNIEKAFELLTSYHNQPERDVTFSLQCGPSNGKGIFLRPNLGDPAKDIAVTIEPMFLQDHKDQENLGVIPRQIEFGMRLAFACRAPWVSAPAHLDLTNTARMVSIRVDATALPHGAHFASVNAYDVRCVDKGPVFRVPVTVLQPTPLPLDSPGTVRLAWDDCLFAPGTVRRHYFIPPGEASWGVLSLGVSGGERCGRFLVHTMQCAPQRSCRAYETHKMLTLSADAPAQLPFRILGGVTVEVVVARYWAGAGDVRVRCALDVHGVRPAVGERVMLHAAEGARGVVLSALRRHDVQVNAQLKYQDQVYRPAESKVSALRSRDVLPPARQVYQILNTYNFTLPKPAEVTPMVLLLCDLLYENEYESQMWMLYSSTKQLLAVGDAYPAKYAVKLEKGDYTVRLGVRHEKRAALERLADLPLVVRTKLAQPLALDAYGARSQAVSGGKKLGPCSVAAGEILPLYFGGVPADKIGKSNLTIGQSLAGTITFAKDELGKRVDVYDLKYVICEAPKKPNSKEKHKPADEFADAHKEFLISWLGKLEGERLEQLYEETRQKYPDCLAAHAAYASALEPPADPKRLPRAGAIRCDAEAQPRFEKIVAIANKVIEAIDRDKLLAQIGMKNDARPDAVAIKQDVERQRAQLVEALCRKGVALAATGADDADLLALTDQLTAFVDLADCKAIHFGVWQCFALRHWARGIKLLNKMADERPAREIDERAAGAAAQLGWTFYSDHVLSALPIRYPNSYRPL